MAKAICRLIHSRGRLCDTSFYSSLFNSILAPSSTISSTALSELNMSFGSFEEDETIEGDKERKKGMNSYETIDHISYEDAYPVKNVVDEAYQLLEEISLTASSPIFVGNSQDALVEVNRPHLSSATVTTTVVPIDNRVRKIANSLIETLNNFQYSESYSNAIQLAILGTSKLPN